MGRKDQDPKARARWIGYVLAAIVSWGVVAGRIALDDFFGHNHNRHLVFLPTVTLVAWLWGFGPGLVATALFTVALEVYWGEARATETFLKANSDVILFVIVGAWACALIQSLRAARLRADAETHGREQVMAVVAHDLRNPLNAVMLAEQRLTALTGRSDGDGQAQQLERSLQTIRHAVSRMLHLIRDLVDATHIEQGSLMVELKPVPVAGMVQEVAELFAGQAQDRRVSLELGAPPPGDVVVEADRERVIQVLGNLLGNSLKFTPEGGHVSVRALERDGFVRFEVEDTGRGIETTHLPHIFERYRTYDPQGGTGLGLFIAQRLLQLHRSELRVRSEVGRGTLFWFEVARPQASQPPRRGASDTRPPAT